MYGSVEYEECVVRSAENEECRKYGMMKMKKKVQISIIALKKISHFFSHSPFLFLVT